MKCVRADPITGNCTPQILEAHVRRGAEEIRRLLLRYGLEEGWRRAKVLFSRPVHAQTRMTDERGESSSGDQRHKKGRGHKDH